MHVGGPPSSPPPPIHTHRETEAQMLGPRCPPPARDRTEFWGSNPSRDDGGGGGAEGGPPGVTALYGGDEGGV